MDDFFRAKECYKSCDLYSIISLSSLNPGKPFAPCTRYSYSQASSSHPTMHPHTTSVPRPTQHTGRQVYDPSPKRIYSADNPLTSPAQHPPPLQLQSLKAPQHHLIHQLLLDKLLHHQHNQRAIPPDLASPRGPLRPLLVPGLRPQPRQPVQLHHHRHLHHRSCLPARPAAARHSPEQRLRGPLRRQRRVDAHLQR